MQFTNLVILIPFFRIILEILISISSQIMNEHKSILKFSRANSPRAYVNHRRSQTEASGCSLSKQQHKEPSKFNMLNSERKYSKRFQLTRGKPDNFYFSMIATASSFSKQSKMRKISQMNKNGTMPQSLIFRTRKNDHSINSNGLQDQARTKKVSFNMGEGKRTTVNTGSNVDEQINEQISLKQSETATPKSLIENDDHVWSFEVERICSSIEELKAVGISDKKINNWCNCYFEGKKKGLIQIFMRRVPKKKSLNGQILYLALSCKTKLMEALKSALKQMSEKQKYFLGVEITLYRNFLEEKIASKHKLELNQIECRVKSNVQQSCIKQFARELYVHDNNSLEMVNFVADLQRVEENFGKLHLISLKNRMRFENIKNSELNIKKLIYQ